MQLRDRLVINVIDIPIQKKKGRKHSSQRLIVILKFRLAYDAHLLIRVQNSSLGMIFFFFLALFSKILILSFESPFPQPPIRNSPCLQLSRFLNLLFVHRSLKIQGFFLLELSWFLLVQAGKITLRTLWISYVSIHCIFH